MPYRQRAWSAVLTAGLSLALAAAPAVASSSPDSGGAALFWPQGHHRYPGDSRHLGDRILRFGMHGHDVRVLQDFLSRAGFGTPIVGTFGPLTKHNVIAFERSRGLRPNGVVTWGVSQALRGAVAARATREVRGARARLVGGLALAPASAPAAVKAVIAAANQIAFRPYLYGGGHGSWLSSGYDCSGSVSFALHGGGLLSSPEDSTTLESYGSAGRGSWITIFANAGHAFMVVAGLRFDTGAQSATGGSRWTAVQRSSAGYVVRHPAGF